jgi:hypothetical protein
MNVTIFDLLLAGILPVAVILAGLAWRAWRLHAPAWSRDIIAAAGAEVVAVYFRVKQRYVDEKKRLSDDGRLTDEEAREAMDLAMAELRGAVSLAALGAALARILGIGGESRAEQWLENQLEVLAANDHTAAIEQANEALAKAATASGGTWEALDPIKPALSKG